MSKPIEQPQKKKLYNYTAMCLEKTDLRTF